MNQKFPIGTRIEVSDHKDGHRQLTIHLPEPSGGCDAFAHYFSDSNNWLGSARTRIGYVADLSPRQSRQLAETVLAPIGGRS